MFLFFFCTTTFCLTRCISRKPADPRGVLYAGSATCTPCHGKIGTAFRATAHFVSTRVAGRATISGSFATGRNRLNTASDTYLEMDQNNDAFFQTLYVRGKELRREPFELVMGSVKGQSYIYRQNGAFFQLPVSWFSTGAAWMLSPGFSAANPAFDRPVTRRCFECHSSWVSETAATDSTQAVWNIDCERCHGPAAAHVDFHRRHPQEKAPQAIAVMASLSREKRIDLCATCHGGTQYTMLRSTFGFQPGDSLAAYRIADFTGTLPIDVHGNQTALLKGSKCYLNSNMDCSTCHNVHENQRNNAASFNQACKNCHSPSHDNICVLAKTDDPAFLSANCIHCHMPAQASEVIRSASAQGGFLSATVVNHRIAVYKDATARVRHDNPAKAVQLHEKK